MDNLRLKAHFCTRYQPVLEGTIVFKNTISTYSDSLGLDYEVINGKFDQPYS